MKAENSVDELLSTVYHVLRAPRRRYVIQMVSESEEEVHAVRTLARKIAASEQNIPLEYATGEPYRNAYNALSQTHLSTLSQADVVIYDPQRQIVYPDTNLDIAALLIEIDTPTVRRFSALIEDDVGNVE